MSRILILTGGDFLGLALLRGLGLRGSRAIVAGTGNGWLNFSRHCEGYVKIAASPAALSDASPAVVDALLTLIRERDVTVVVPGDLSAAFCAAKLKPLLPGVGFFPCAEPATLRLLDNKWTFCEFLLAHGLPTPRSWKIDSAETLGRLSPPLVIKPLIGSGGVGVSVVRDAARRDACLSGDGAFLRSAFMAQEFVDGEDVDVSFLADRGRLVAWAVQVRDRRGVIHYIQDDQVLDIARRVATATAYSGVAHIDMRYDGPARAAVKVIECNPRFWGSLQYTFGFDVDFIGRGLAMASGGVVEAAAAGPMGASEGVAAAARRFLSGRFDMPRGTRGYLRQKFGDPLPEVYNGIRKLLRIPDAL